MLWVNAHKAVSVQKKPNDLDPQLIAQQAVQHTPA